MILSVLEFDGDPDDLASRMREHVSPVSRRLAPEFGGISSTVVRTDWGDGVNLWRDYEGRYEVLAHQRVEVPAPV